MAFERCHFCAGDHFEMVRAPFRMELACLEAGLELVVVGDRDQVKVRMVLDKLEQLAEACHAVAQRGVQMQIGLAVGAVASWHRAAALRVCCSLASTLSCSRRKPKGSVLQPKLSRDRPGARQ